MKGTIRRRGNTWSYQFSHVEGGQRKHVQRGGFRLRKEAEAELAAALAAFGKGDRRRTIAPSSEPLGDYLTRWLDGRRPSLKPTTFDSYEAALRSWLIPSLGGIALRDLTASRLGTFYAALRKGGGRSGRPLGSRSVNMAHTILSMALNDAVDEGLIAVSPLSQLPKRQRPTHRPTKQTDRVWDPEQAAAFLEATRDDRLHALWALALDSGARRGELGGLRWSSLDLEAGVMTVRSNRVQAGRQTVEHDTKTGRVRSVDLDSRTAVILRRWKAAQAAERLAAGPAYSDLGYVFADPLGQPYRPDGLSHRFERARARLALPAIRFHDLRHTSGTIALASGVPAHVVSARLGHADVATTLRSYAHCLPRQGEDAAARIGAAIYGNAP